MCSDGGAAAHHGTPHVAEQVDLIGTCSPLLHQVSDQLSNSVHVRFAPLRIDSIRPTTQRASNFRAELPREPARMAMTPGSVTVCPIVVQSLPAPCRRHHRSRSDNRFPAASWRAQFTGLPDHCQSVVRSIRARRPHARGGESVADTAIIRDRGGLCHDRNPALFDVVGRTA